MKSRNLCVDDQSKGCFIVGGAGGGATGTRGAEGGDEWPENIDETMQRVERVKNEDLLLKTKRSLEKIQWGSREKGGEVRGESRGVGGRKGGIYGQRLLASE